MSQNICGVRRPNWEYEPADWKHVQCILSIGHDGAHSNDLGDTWVNSREWEDAYEEVLCELIWALADHVRNGSVTLDTAAAIYSQTSAGAFDSEYAKNYLVNIMAEEMLEDFKN